MSRGATRRLRCATAALPYMLSRRHRRSTQAVPTCRFALPPGLQDLYAQQPGAADRCAAEHHHAGQARRRAQRQVRAGGTPLPPALPSASVEHICALAKPTEGMVASSPVLARRRRCCKGATSFALPPNQCQCDNMLKAVLPAGDVTPTGLDGMLKIVGAACNATIPAC